MKKTVLFVDSQNQISGTIHGLVTDDDFTIFLVDNAHKAMDLLKTTPVDLIVSDIGMLSMDGVGLLKYVKLHYPATLRMALSANTDSKKVFDALDGNLAKLYLIKPWNHTELVDTIKKLFDLEELLHDEELLNVIHDFDDLPIAPSLYMQLCHLISNEEAVDAVAKVIEQDPSIVSRILRIANSAFYGAKTASLHDAIMYIGLVNIKNIVLSNSVFSAKMMKNKYIEDLWKHTQMTNKLMQAIYKNALKKQIPVSFATAGLLHDIGRVVMINNLGSEYLEIINKARIGRGKLLSQLEEERMGIDHTVLGGYLLNSWELPIPLIEAALYHHDPFNPMIINKEIVAVVHIANYYAWGYQKRNPFVQPLKYKVFSFLGIRQGEVEAIVKATSETDDLMR